MLALAFPTKQIRQRVEGMSVEMQATRFQIRWLQFTSAFPHFCVKPLDVFQGDFRRIPSCVSGDNNQMFFDGKSGHLQP